MTIERKGTRYKKKESKEKLFDERNIFTLIMVIAVSLCIASFTITIKVSNQLEYYKEYTMREDAKRSSASLKFSPLSLDTFGDTSESYNKIVNSTLDSVVARSITEDILSIERANPPPALFAERKKISDKFLGKSNLTADEINSIIDKMLIKKKVTAETKIRGIGKYLIEAEKTSNINALYIMSIMSFESGYGTSAAAINRNNLAGVFKDDSLRRYDSVPESVIHLGNLLYTYYTSKGRDTFTELAKLYCCMGDETNAKWIGEVERIKNEYIKMYYAQFV
jgi:uncharacterized FlgJ-related protein